VLDGYISETDLARQLNRSVRTLQRPRLARAAGAAAQTGGQCSPPLHEATETRLTVQRARVHLHGHRLAHRKQPTPTNPIHGDKLLM